MSIWEHHSYRSYLRTILEQRANVSSSYSLRAFAKSLKINPSFLSAVLKGKKNISNELALVVSNKLKLAPAESEYFCLLAQIDSTKSPHLKKTLLDRAQSLNPKQEVHNLSVDHFRMISDWYHFAILASTELKDMDTRSKSLAHALGLPQATVDLAIERLERLEMIKKDSADRLHKTDSNPRVISDSPNEALRTYHRQTLLKAIDSLESQSPKEKIIGSETLAIDHRQLKDFAELVEGFFSKALSLAKKGQRKDRVYHLGVQFFSFTQSQKEK